MYFNELRQIRDAVGIGPVARQFSQIRETIGPVRTSEFQHIRQAGSLSSASELLRHQSPLASIRESIARQGTLSGIQAIAKSSASELLRHQSPLAGIPESIARHQSPLSKLSRIQESIGQAPLSPLRHGTLSRIQESLDSGRRQEVHAVPQKPAVEPGLTPYKNYYVSLGCDNGKWQVHVSCGGTQPAFRAAFASGSEAMTRAKTLIDTLDKIDIDFCNDSVCVTFASGTGLTEARAFSEALHGFEIVPA